MSGGGHRTKINSCVHEREERPAKITMAYRSRSDI